jgi:hypothetical protein
MALCHVGGGLLGFSTWRSSSSLTCLYRFQLGQQPEWRFCVADSVPVLLSGNDLKAHLTVYPSSMCSISRLCSPSQDVRSPLLSPPEAEDISVCLLLPVLTETLASHGKHTIVCYVFLQLLPHLVSHAPWSSPAFNRLLGTSRGKGTS